MAFLASTSLARYGSIPHADDSTVLIDESSDLNGKVVLKKQVGLVSAVAIIAGTVIGG